MLSLGQKLKIPKTCEKPLYKNIRVLLGKKRENFFVCVDRQCERYNFFAFTAVDKRNEYKNKTEF